jgi:hypothetical protein
MFAIAMIVVGITLLGLFFLFGGHRSRLQGASKKTKLPKDVAPEPLGESMPSGHRHQLSVTNRWPNEQLLVDRQPVEQAHRPSGRLVRPVPAARLNRS